MPSHHYVRNMHGNFGYSTAFRPSMRHIPASFPDMSVGVRKPDGTYLSYPDGTRVTLSDMRYAAWCCWVLDGAPGPDTAR